MQEPQQILTRYLPVELAEALRVAQPAPAKLAEALVHSTAACYAVSTYLPQRLVRRRLAGDGQTPWVEWIDGSLLFADISGSTALAERLGGLGREGTELVTDFLNAFFAAMIGVIHAHGGDLLNFGGDALLVLFAAPQHSHTATQAALALQHEMHGFQRTAPGIGDVALHMHIGVESGQLALASVGEPEALRYVVLGQPVNGVARAESHAGPAEVVLGPAAWATVGLFASGIAVADGHYRVSAVPALDPEPLADLILPEAESPSRALALLTRHLAQLAPYLPPSLLGRILADPLRPLVEADLRPVSVLFVQIIGLGALAERLDAARTAQMLQLYVGEMQRAIHRFGGVVNKLDVSEQGDKLLALFGAPLAFEDHAERALRAALAMSEALPEVQAQIDRLCAEAGQQQVPFCQRIGINTGTVFAGNVGTDERKEYTVMGDAVNTAARVMACAGWGEIWVSPTTLAAAERFAYSDQGSFQLKGKRKPLHLYRLDGERAPASDSADSPRTPLVGRERELARLREKLRAAAAGQGGALRIVGEAGVGKSRLASEAIAEARRLGMQVICAANFSYTSNIPYTAWAEWLKARCAIAAGDGPERRASLLSARLAELGPEMTEWLPLLADLVRIEVEESRLTRALDPQLRQERRFDLLRRLIMRATADAPLLTVIEDLHWADPISLDLWQQLSRQVGDAPILLLGLHRPGLDWRDDAGDAAEVLALDELSQHDSNTLIEALFGGKLPASLCDQLVQRSMGNPLYLEELLRALVERGLIVEGERGYHSVGDLSQVELPDSLNGLLLARIDRLDESWRNLLRMASVIGQRFPSAVLRSLSGVTQQSLLSSLAGLSEQALIVAERENPERVDIFRHALLHEVAYQSLLYARRRELHGRIGDYLERIHGSDLDDYYGLLAHHYRLSDSPDKAVTYLLKAGHAARAIYANEEAMQQYTWALETISDDADPRAWQARDALADVLAVVGRYDEALDHYAIIMAQRQAPLSLLVEVRRKRGSVLEKQGAYREALQALRELEALANAERAALPALALPAIRADLASVLVRLGEYDTAISSCEHGLSQLVHDSRSRDDELIEARLHSTIGTIYGMRGDYAGARHHFERSLAARTLIDDIVGVVTCNNNLGYLWQLQSDYAQAMRHYAVAEQNAQQLGLLHGLYFTYANSAYAAYCLGQYDEAEHKAQEALALCASMNNRSGQAMVLDTLGFIHFSRGNYAAAMDAFEGSLALHRALGSLYQEGNTLAAGLAPVYNAIGQPERGLELARQALRRGEELQAQQLQLEALNAAAEAHLLLGDPHAAWHAAEQAAALSRNLGSKSDRASAFRLLGEAAAALEEPCERFFEYSMKLADEIANRFELARAQAAYGRALLHRGEQQQATVHLKAARATFIQLGSLAELSRLELCIERNV